MTADVAAASENRRPGLVSIVLAFIALLALTGGELIVIGLLQVERAARITALAGLLMTKVGVVMAFFMHARANRRAAWFVLVAIAFAAGVGVVLMLETAFRVGVA